MNKEVNVLHSGFQPGYTRGLLGGFKNKPRTGLYPKPISV